MKTNLGYKFKLLTKEELIISLDRLTRFKLPDESFFRVFSSIITKCLISPKLSKNEIENLSADELSTIVELIWNKSVENIFGKENREKKINLLKYLALKSYKNFEEKTKRLINTRLFITKLLETTSTDILPPNMKFLKKCTNCQTESEIKNIIKKNKLFFPVRKLIIVEGITEEILLPVFAKKLGCSFEENGIFILGAGGKSKSPSLYMKLKEKLKIPVVLLFDNDAQEISNILSKNLLNKDKIIVIEKGEFEDILSLNLIKRSLNKEYLPATKLTIDELRIFPKMCDNIENFYRTRHLGEYKKSKVSKIIANNIYYKSDISEEIKDIIFSII